MLSATTLPQILEADANASSNILNEGYTTAGIDGTHVAKVGQINLWFMTTIPVAREAEFDAASEEDKTKFALIGASAMALTKTNPSKTYLVLWEQQYLIYFS